jgi:hypothetical protein
MHDLRGNFWPKGRFIKSLREFAFFLKIDRFMHQKLSQQSFSRKMTFFSEKWSTSQEVILGNLMHVLIACWSDFKKDLGLRKSMQQSVV